MRVRPLAAGQSLEDHQVRAARLAAGLAPYGWDVKVKTSGDVVTATARRGTGLATESLRLVWVDGAYDYSGSSLRSGATNRKVRNLSEAIGRCAVPS